MNIFILNGSKMINKISCHEQLKKILRLPEYYGNNLDALEECLYDFDESSIIILTNKEEMLENLGTYGTKLLQVFEAGVEESGYIFKAE